jgi:uncharacterized membrane protein YGL010W
VDLEDGGNMFYRNVCSHTDYIPLCKMASSVMLCRVALVKTDVSEELSASFIRVTRIGELGTILVTLMKEALSSS